MAPPFSRIAYIAGKISKLDTVAANNPPITACPRGATCSPPSMMPNAIGNIPTIMANPVMRIGRARLLAPSRAASSDECPCFR